MALVVQSSRSALLNDLRVPPRSEVSAVRKALELLGCFSIDTPAMPLSQLARKLDIPKSTAHNLLRTLQSFDLVRQDPASRRYRLGPRAMELGLLFSRRTEVLAHARPVLRKLAEETRETVKLGILSSNEVLIIAAIESSHQLHTRGDIGRRWPLHSCSLGKAMLSALPNAEAEEILQAKGMPRYMDSTITTWPDMQRELNRIRNRRYALDLEENEAGVCCAAAPVVDPLRGAVAAISVSGPTVRLDKERLIEIGRRLSRAASIIESNTQSEEI